ncbi:cell division protein [Selenomonas sp. oral taxon 920]|uniref:cell division FtsA domain-containing protein n=1 Tax=Selenomonas sp. oral taxon 920 TaxID=1884263 RepID=UPI00084096BF|nr:cell division FtsA domain-containing protein [Selenomonas sp. oral taxon 920]AOH47270.1 cell division protein [Selenomonas sp. oral taxon 920]
MPDLDKTNEEIHADTPAKKRGRPKKRVQEEMEDTTAKKRGRPKKVEAGVVHAASHRERPSELVFALDIGTRSVIGIVAEQREGLLHILATERMEHKTRAMLDGQIHDVPQVAAIIREVKRRLTERTGALSSAAVAAAGRALYTMTAEAEQDVTGTITPAQQRDLDFAGVQAAQKKLAHSHTVDDPTRYYCVGYSTIRYTLDGNDLKTLVGQRGRHAQATVIATFLPRQVVDSMQSALRETHLEMRALTLEPIAGINVLIPPTMRHLNLVLVDIGAGTSDVAITRGGSVIAYGMVPMAGDEITEAISREYLLDFNIAEDIKRKAADGQDVSFTDILGMKLSLTAEQVVTAIRPGVEHLANAIAKQILELNGEPPQAVMLVGGGALTPMMPELVAAALGIPEARVAVRQPEEVDGVVELPAELHAPDAVTPLGILKIASINTLHFLAVWINDIEYSLFNFRELNVSDALLAAGISLRKYNGRPGMGLMITVNGERRSFPGTMGTLAQITIDGKSASLDSPIHDDCRIKLVAGENGTQPEIRLSEIIGTVDSYTVSLNGEETAVTANILINDSVPEGDPILRDGDVIVSRRERTLGEVLRAANLPPTGRRISYTLNGEARRFSTQPHITLNDAPAPLSTMLHEGDVIEYEETAIPTVETVLDLSAAASYATITYEGREHAVPASGFGLTINGREASASTVVEDGAVIAYQKGTGSANVSEALLAVGFTPPPATSRVTFAILVNGIKADFTSPIHTGDTLEVAFTPLDSLNPTTEKSSENTPAASAILGSIAARTNLTQAEEHTAAPQEEVPSANAAQNDITIDSLMRYD